MSDRSRDANVRAGIPLSGEILPYALALLKHVPVRPMFFTKELRMRSRVLYTIAARNNDHNDKGGWRN